MHDTVMVLKNFHHRSSRLISGRKMVFFSASVALFIGVIALAAPVLAPHDPTAVDLAAKLKYPSFAYPFGTDHLGRCILSRIIFGARVSLKAAAIVVVISASTGTLLGVISGYFGGLIDSLTMRVVDIMLAFPSIIFALAIVAALGPGLENVIIALAFVHWTTYARLARSEVLAIKEREFVESARALGNGHLRILLQYVFPNIAASIVVMATLDIAHVILSAAGLSFLGLGAQPPVPEWGAMVNEGREFIRTAPHLTVFPGLAIMVTVLSLNMLGDGIRDALDPRTQNRKVE